MRTKDAKIAMIGAGAIGGITAAFIRQAGHDLEIVCKHQELADRINDRGIHITGIKGEHRVKLKAVKTIADLSGPQDLVFLATKSTDCVEAARDLRPFLKPSPWPRCWAKSGLSAAWWGGAQATTLPANWK